MIQELLDQLATFSGQLKRHSSVNVNDRETKEAAIALASAYFSTYRTEVVKAIGESDAVRRHDESWQNFVRLVHANNQRRTYVKLLGSLIKEVREFSVLSLARTADTGGHGVGPSDLSPAELALVSTLERLLPTAAASYRQGLLDLQVADRLSYRGTASEFRETLRETLDHLAPDAGGGREKARF